MGLIIVYAAMRRLRQVLHARRPTFAEGKLAMKVLWDAVSVCSRDLASDISFCEGINGSGMYCRDRLWWHQLKILLSLWRAN